jgi:hypothetical protein
MIKYGIQVKRDIGSSVINTFNLALDGVGR